MGITDLIAQDPGWIILVKGLLIFVVCVVSTLMAVWGERRIVARIADAYRTEQSWAIWFSASVGRWSEVGS